jgi:hypothetical protein
MWREPLNKDQDKLAKLQKNAALENLVIIVWVLLPIHKHVKEYVRMKKMCP